MEAELLLQTEQGRIFYEAAGNHTNRPCFLNARIFSLREAVEFKRNYRSGVGSKDHIVEILHCLAGSIYLQTKVKKNMVSRCQGKASGFEVKILKFRVKLKTKQISL